MIIMSIDLGLTRTGLAVCDKAEMLASPIGTITEKNRENLAKIILEKVLYTQTELIVLGFPKNMNGTLGESAENVQKFKNLLESQSNIPIILWDERMTTISAINYLNKTNTRGKKRKNVVDTLSAVIILENYLEYRKNKKIHR